MTSPAISLLRVCLMGLLLLAPAGLRAAPAAEKLYQQALQRYSEAEFETSIVLLNRALRSGGSPRLLGQIHFQLGINHAVMGEPDKAEQAFREALKRRPELRLDTKQVKPAIVELLARVRRSVRGYLSVSADGADVTVQVDGEDPVELPHEVLLSVGVHQVVVRCADGKRSRRLVVHHGRTARLHVRCGQPPAATQTGTGGAVSPSSGGRDALPGRSRVWTWVAAGSAVAALGVAIGLGASSSADYSEFSDLVASGRRDEVRRQELESAIESKALGANVLFGVAGALALTSVVLYFVEGRAAPRPPAATAAAVSSYRIHAVVGPTTGLILQLQF